MEKSEFSERLNKIRRHFKLSQEQMAEKLGIPFRTYQRMESGEGEKVNRHVLETYAMNGVNLNWLFTGEGPMFINIATEESDLVGVVLGGADKDEVVNRFEGMDAEISAMKSEFETKLKDLRSRLARLEESSRSDKQ
jgi:transcriptional regulator with XRE-family HTH domain